MTDSKRKRRWIIGVAIGISIPVLLWLLPQIFASQIQQLVFDTVNKDLNTEIKVGGNIKVSIFKHFPKLSLEFPELKIASATQKDKQLAHIKSAYLLFNPFSLLGNKPELTKIVISDGFVHLQKEADGTYNFEIWKKDTTSVNNTEKSELSINIKELVFNNIDLQYVEVGKPNKILGVFLDYATFKANFKAETTSLLTQVNFRNAVVDWDDFTYNNPSATSLSVDCFYESSKKKLLFSKSKVALNGQTLLVSGFWIADETQNIQVDLAAKNIAIEEWIGLVPAMQSFVEQWRVSGLVDATAKVYSNNKDLDIEASGNLGNIKLKHYESGEQLTFQGAWKLNQKKGNTQVDLNNFTLKNDAGTLSGNFTASGKKNLNYVLKATGTADIYAIALLLDIPEVKSGSAQGDFELKFTDEQLNGRNAAGMNLVMNADIINLGLDVDNMGFEAIDCKLKALGNTLTLEGVKGKLNESPFTANLNIQGFKQLIPDATGNVMLQGNVQIDAINLNIFGGSVDTSKVALAANTSPSQNTLMNRLYADLNIRANKFDFEKFTAQNVITNLWMAPGYQYFKQISCKTIDGDLKGELEIQDKLAGKQDYLGVIEGNTLQVKKLFSSFDNFSQDFLTDQHLSGRASVKAAFRLAYDKDFNFIAPESKFLCNFQIDDGNLKDFKPIEALSSFIDIKELQQLRFSKMSNEIRLENGLITIPEMDIKTNAARFSVAGTHTLDNVYTYYIKLNLSNLLMNSARRKNENLTESDSDNKGGIILYLTITGDGDDFVVKYDKSKVKAAFKEATKKGAEDVRDLIKNELRGTQSKTQMPETIAPESEFPD